MKPAIIALSAILAAGFTAPAFAEADLKRGERVFRKCKACHQVGEEAKHKTGPLLNDIFGRAAGTMEGFENKYSNAMKEAGAEGLIWTEETLGEYLVKPKKFIPKTKMSFAGIKKEDDIANLMGYLLQFSPDYVAGGGEEADGEEGDQEGASEQTDS